ncbi:hypothetical protein [Streptomyces sp. NPDC001833]
MDATDGDSPTSRVPLARTRIAPVVARTDKLAIAYQAALHVATILIWTAA